MDLKIIIASEVWQRKTMCLWNLEKKKDTHELIYTTEHRLRKQIHGYQRGEVVGRDKSGVWHEHVHTIIYKIDHHKALLCSTGNPTEYSIIT